jgi:hypothetical protein
VAQPLLDHFRPPLRLHKPWEGCHAMWLATMVQQLNGSLLPKRFEAEPESHRGTRIQVDVGTFEDEDWRPPAPLNGHGGTAVAAPRYVAPAPGLAAEVSLAEADVFEVKVYKDLDGWKLVAAVELVSESNKHDPDGRRTFAVKCGSYLSAGVSVVVVDVVTTRHGNLHADLCGVLALPADLSWEPPGGLSAVAYRPAPAGDPAAGRVRLEVWPHELRVGESLPTVPLWLAADLAVPLDLDATYAAACRSLRLA